MKSLQEEGRRVVSRSISGTRRGSPEEKAYPWKPRPAERDDSSHGQILEEYVGKRGGLTRISVRQNPRGRSDRVEREVSDAERKERKLGEEVWKQDRRRVELTTKRIHRRARQDARDLRKTRREGIEVRTKNDASKEGVEDSRVDGQFPPP